MGHPGVFLQLLWRGYGIGGGPHGGALNGGGFRVERGISVGFVGIVFGFGVGGIGDFGVVDGLHDDDLVAAFFVIAVGDAEFDDVLGDFEFSLLADGENDGMFFIERADVIFHVVGAEDVLGTEFFVGVDVSGADGGENAAQAAEAIFFGAAGTASIFSIMARSLCFLSLPRAGSARSSANVVTRTV